MLYALSRSMVRVVYRLLFRLEAWGVSNIPPEGPVILCSNHTSALDPFTLGAMVPRKVHYMAKDKLFKIPVVSAVIRAWGAFPVKRGAVSKEAIRTAINLMSKGHASATWRSWILTDPKDTRIIIGCKPLKERAFLSLAEKNFY